MEFILYGKKYSISNHELYINYLMVDNYFRHHYSKYDYDIRFDFITPILKKDRVVFDDILEGTKVLEELLEKQEISFIAPGLRIDEISKNKFTITYQDMQFKDINVGEAIPLIIALDCLLNYKPIVTLTQIREELDNFIEKFRSYNAKNDL